MSLHDDEIDLLSSRRCCGASNVGGGALESGARGERRVDMECRAMLSLLMDEARHAILADSRKALLVLRGCRDNLQDIALDSMSKTLGI